MLRKKIIKRCAQGHEMELSWKRCPRCTGRRPLQVEARDVVDQTMIAGPEAAPVDATRVVTPSVVRSRPPAAVPAPAPDPPKFVPAPPPPPRVHPSWAGPSADPGPAHPAWAGPPASPAPASAPPPAATPAPVPPPVAAPAPRVHPSWAGPSANPSPPPVEAPPAAVPAPAYPAWAGPPAATPAPAPPATTPAPSPPPVAAAPPAPPPAAPSPAEESGVADRAFFERDAEISKAPSGRKAKPPAEPSPPDADVPPPAAAPGPAAVPGLSRDLSVRSRAKIECVGGPLKGRMFMLSSGAYRLGKAPRDLPDSKAIVIAGDRFVSKDHAVILVEPNGIVLTDPGSTNGCFVNGNKVTHHTLENGDEIRLGESVFKFSKLGS